MSTSPPCLRCGRGPLISTRQWRAGNRDHGVRHEGRNLCATCYLAATRDGTLDRYPTRRPQRPRRPSRPRDDLMRRWEQLRDEECTITQAAVRIGISRTGLHDAIDRARRAGDARARTTTLDKTTLDRLRALVGAPR